MHNTAKQFLINCFLPAILLALHNSAKYWYLCNSAVLMILLQMLFQWGSATTWRALWYAWLQEEAQGGGAFRTLQTKSLAQNKRRKSCFFMQSSCWGRMPHLLFFFFLSLPSLWFLGKPQCSNRQGLAVVPARLMNNAVGSGTYQEKYLYRDFLKTVSDINSSATILLLEAPSFSAVLVLTCHG